MKHHKRNASLTTLVSDAQHSIAEYARWPDVPARAETVKLDVAILSEALHGHDPVVPRSIFLKLVADLLESDLLRGMPPAGMRVAINRLCDLIDPPKESSK